MTKLDELVKAITKKHIFIQMHNYPDQDAISSAFGLQTLLKDYNIEATICHYGQVDKVNTLRMIEHLEINMVELSCIQWEADDEVILVDGQKGNENMMEIGGSVIACIDHHPKTDVSEYRFYDIRSKVGSCATIIAEYFVENLHKIPMMAATALLYGIKIDTSNLTRRVTNLDIAMFSILYEQADRKILRELDQSSLQKEDLVAYLEAISTLQIYDEVGVANIGDDCSEALLGSISDFLLTLKEVQVIIVYSYRVGGIKFSFRTKSPMYNAGNLIKEALEGYGGGGGHSTVAAGFCPNVEREDVDNISEIIIGRMLSKIKNTI